MLTTLANTHSKSPCPSKRAFPYYASASLGAVGSLRFPLSFSSIILFCWHLRGPWCAALELDQSGMRRPRYTLISHWPFLLNKLGYATQLKLINAKLAK